MLRRPSVRRPSSFTISKIFSETAGPIVLILHIHHLQVGGKNNCVFCFDRIRTLVAMATYASHRLIMEKSENCQFLLSCWRYLNFVFAEMFIEYSNTPRVLAYIANGKKRVILCNNFTGRISVTLLCGICDVSYPTKQR